MTTPRKCIRPKCPNLSRRRGSGLCEKHYCNSPTRGHIPAAPVLEHLHKLYARGLTQTTIADLAGIDRTTLQGLGKWTEAAGVQKRVAQAITSIEIPEKFTTGKRSIPNVGTRRRLQALMAAGWSQQVLAEKFGRSTASIYEWMHNTSVFGETAARVEQVFDELCMVPGPSKRVANIAKRNGWAPPMAWDDNTIDSPEAKPYGLEPQAPQPFLEKYAEMRGLGLSDIEVARRTGATYTAVARRLDRNQLPVSTELRALAKSAHRKGTQHETPRTTTRTGRIR